MRKQGLSRRERNMVEEAVTQVCWAMGVSPRDGELRQTAWAEILSVVLQVSYFKATHGKRLFKMSPIHHHFEMCGWSEMKICGVFGLVSLLGSAVAFLCVLFGV